MGLLDSSPLSVQLRASSKAQSTSDVRTSDVVRRLGLGICPSTSHSHTHTHSLSLVLVVMIKSKELKTKISLTHSLILSVLLTPLPISPS